MAGIKPVLQALLVADHVYQDKLTGKHVVCGVFGVMFRHVATPSDGTIDLSSDNRIKSGFNSGSPFAFLSLIDVDGEQEFSLRYVRLKDDVVIFTCKIRVNSPDRLIPVQTAIPLPPLPRDDGVYALELIWNDVEPLGSYRISVMPPSGENL